MQVCRPLPRAIPGRVVNPGGSVGRAALTDSQADGVDWQHQLFSVRTNRPDARAHYRQNLGARSLLRADVHAVRPRPVSRTCL